MHNYYYIIHKIYIPSTEKILNILEDGYLCPSSETNESGLYPGGTLRHIYFSLFGNIKDINTLAGITLILDPVILYKYPFRYALTWIGNDLNKSIKANPKYDNINEILQKINKHIQKNIKENPNEIGTHEILLNKKINLHKYLVAICCTKRLSKEIINYIKKKYPNTMLLDEYPETAQKLNNMIQNYYKYNKYKTKYLNLKNNLSKI